MRRKLAAAVRSKLPLAAVAAVTASLALTGCGYPAGGSKGFKGSAHTWVSTEHRPISLTLYDTRTNEAVWMMDVPAGRKLITRFVEGVGDDEVMRPDRLEYDVVPIEHRTGGLYSMINVPAASVRRWELTVRPGPEYAPEAPEPMVEESILRNRPEWWTPEGGPMPDDYEHRKQ